MNEQSIDRANRGPGKEIARTLRSTTWACRIAGGAVLTAVLVTGGSAFEALLATGVGMAVAELAWSRGTVKRLRRHAPGKPDRDLQPFTGQAP